MVGLQILVRIDPKKRGEFLHVAELIRNAEKEKGSLISCHVYEDIEVPNRFICIYQSSDEKWLAEYRKSEKFKALLGCFDVLGEQLESKEFNFEEALTT